MLCNKCGNKLKLGSNKCSKCNEKVVLTMVKSMDDIVLTPVEVPAESEIQTTDIKRTKAVASAGQGKTSVLTSGMPKYVLPIAAGVAIVLMFAILFSIFTNDSSTKNIPIDDKVNTELKYKEVDIKEIPGAPIEELEKGSNNHPANGADDNVYVIIE